MLILTHLGGILGLYDLFMWIHGLKAKVEIIS
jgi:hypothetical protein